LVKVYRYSFINYTVLMVRLWRPDKFHKAVKWLCVCVCVVRLA